TLDSHLELPEVRLDERRLRSVELAPFSAMVTASIPLVMTAHVVYPAIDPDWPATLSARWLRILREQLDFGGVIVTHDREMKAIHGRRSMGEASIAALRAGCDSLLVCNHEALQREAFEAVSRRVASDRDLYRRVEESSARMQALRCQLPRFKPI